MQADKSALADGPDFRKGTGGVEPEAEELCSEVCLRSVVEFFGFNGLDT